MTAATRSALQAAVSPHANGAGATAGARSPARPLADAAEAADGFLATPAARRLADEALSLLAERACTTVGRARIKSLTPCATEAEALARITQVTQWRARAEGLDAASVRAQLRRIKAPLEPPPRIEAGRLVVADEETQERLRSAGAHRWVTLAGLPEVRQAEDYDVVLVLREGGADGLDNAIERDPEADLADLAPESVTSWFTANRGLLEAMQELARLTGLPSRAGEALAAIDALPPAGPPPDLLAAARAVQPLLRAELRQRAATLSVSGTELLDAFGRKAPAPLQAAIDATLRLGRDLMRERTGIAMQAFAAEPSIDLDEEEVHRVASGLRSQSALQRFEARVRAARALAPLREHLAREAESWVAFDVEHALGCAASELDLTAPRFGTGLSMSRSVHLRLAGDSTAQRIDYRLPASQRIALLTGANSGGKTTLLEHVAQLVVLARHGLPVVGRDVVVPWVDEVHVVTAKRSLDAGAFESFLKAFLPVVAGGKRRLVLADEVESVTELEAAGRILGFFLDRLAATSSYAVVVTHVAPQILTRTHAKVRVDGIEATGLDERNRLVVDRSPRMGHYARSTPELIVQRLAAVTKGPHKALYQDLLAAFQDPPPAPPPAR